MRTGGNPFERVVEAGIRSRGEGTGEAGVGARGGTRSVERLDWDFAEVVNVGTRRMAEQKVFFSMMSRTRMGDIEIMLSLAVLYEKTDRQTETAEDNENHREGGRLRKRLEKSLAGCVGEEQISCAPKSIWRVDLEGKDMRDLKS